MQKSDVLTILKNLPSIKEYHYHYYFAQVTMNNQDVFNNVVLLDQDIYLQQWESLPSDQPIQLDNINAIEAPPYCLTSSLAQQVFDQVQEINDTRIFYFKLKNDKLMQCQTDFIPSFLKMPTGYSILDIDKLEKVDSPFTHQKRADFHVKSLEYFWCYY